MRKEINKEYLKKDQYSTTKNLEARIKIHQFTTNKYSFHEWIFNQYDLSKFNFINQHQLLSLSGGSVLKIKGDFLNTQKCIVSILENAK